MSWQERAAKWFLAIGALLALSACSGGDSSIDGGRDDDPGLRNIVLGARDSQVVTIHADGESRQVTFDGIVEATPLGPYEHNVVVLVEADEARQFHLLDTTTGETKLFFESRRPPNISQPSFGSAWISLHDAQDATGWTAINLASGEMLSPDDQVLDWPPRFATDTPLLAYSTISGGVKTIDLRDGTTTDLGARPGFVVGISPTGERIMMFDDGTNIVASTTTDESVVANDVRTLLGWLDDTTPIVSTGDVEIGTIDLETGETTSTQASASSQVLGGPVMLDRLSGQDGSLTIVELPSGTRTVEKVPVNSPIFGLRWMSDRYIWGFIGNAGGSFDSLGGWVFDRELGVVTSFEQPLGDDQFFDPLANAYTPDRSAAVLTDNIGGIYLAASGSPLQRLPIENAQSAAFCADSSIVAYTRNSDQPTQLLAAGSYDILATFESADWALCATAPS